MPNKVIPIFSSMIEIIVPSEVSNSTMCAFIETAPPGGGPPPHMHDREEEFFMVLEGEFEFYFDGAWTPFREGMSRLSPRGHYHGFRNVGKSDARMLAMTNGGGIDEYFATISGMKLPDDQERLTEVSNHYGYHYLPPGESMR